MFEIASIVLVLAGLFSFVNFKYLRLPTTVGVTLMALVASLALVLVGSFGITFRQHAEQIMAGIDFNRIVLHGMLAFLLFAGAFKLDVNDLRPQWGAVTLLALVGTFVSTLMIGCGMYYVLSRMHLPVKFSYSLLFGALISPTDPVAVLAIMKTAGAPKSLETQITGEALFNDGVGVVAFLSILSVIDGQTPPTVAGILLMLFQQVGGAIALGLLVGFAVYQLIKRVDDYQVEALLTVALAMGSYALAEALQVSAPICVVVAGLFIGNRGRTFGMSKRTQEHLDPFWELIDNILNVVLFMLLGLEVLVVQFHSTYLIAGGVAIAVSLLARWLSVAGIVTSMAWLGKRFVHGTIAVLTWGGLRGGLSLAMALALPASDHRQPIIAATYCVVVFSVVIQGLTIAPLVQRASRSREYTVV